MRFLCGRVPLSNLGHIGECLVFGRSVAGYNAWLVSEAIEGAEALRKEGKGGGQINPS